MPLLDSVPITSCHECVATLTLPLALFLLLAETTIGGVATVAYLSLTGGLTRGFLKFIAVTYAILAALAFLVVLAAPPGSYQRLFAINQSAAGALVFLQGLLVIVMLAQVVVIWRRPDASFRSWVPTLAASALLLAGIVAALWPLARSPLEAAGITLTVMLSAAVLGAATTGMLLGHWYLVTPALTNAPLLRAIVVLLGSLVLQAILFPLTLAGLTHGSGSVTGALGLSPVLSILWALAAVVLPLVASGLALPTGRLRSFMSTTGLLYLAMIAILPGQLLGQLLFFIAASA
ncbi:MAG: hypothetical protein E6I99_00915 [Chloroflexi bacterium]|nr:MAG: hypothetical protein E6I99_00915 [Chloroflexota bacterium]TMD85229.1 MAG: hypothetical protein E6I74_01080 [Chloroflexota bacterium]